MSITKPDGTLLTHSGTWPVPLPFSQAVAMMGHWSYNPTKDGISGTPWSQFTYHWANFMFDGPATPWKTGYVPPPGAPIDTTSMTTGNGDHLDQNPTDPVHINIMSNELNNPRLWGIYADGGSNAGTFQQNTCAQQDPKDTSHWAQVSVNGGPWLDMPSIRDVGSPFVDEFNNASGTNVSDVTFVTPLQSGSAPGQVHQGDNTVQFRTQFPSSCSSHGIGVGYFEIQVDPNTDLPPANPTGTIPTPLPLPSTTPISTPVGSAQPPLPTPTSTPKPFIGKITVPFEDALGQDVVLNGQYPAGQINWVIGNWWLSSPWQLFTTKSMSFNGNIGIQQASFSLLVPGHLESLQAYNGDSVSSMISISCTGLPSITATVQPGAAPTTISTNWVGDCRNITLASSNGWHTNFDNMVFADPTIGSSLSPSPTSSPITCPKGSIGDLDCDNKIGVFDYNILISNFGKTGSGIQGALDGDGKVGVFDYNILISNFGK